MYFKKLLVLISLFNFIPFQAQEKAKLPTKKTYTAHRVSKAPDIDGILDDAAWQDKEVATNFVMADPGDGDPMPASHKTRVKVVYNDEAVFFAAYMKESHPEKVVRQFTQRDNMGQAEFFLIDINPYNDGENQTRFIVTSAGALADGKSNGNSEDYSYNVVWNAKVSHDENGWYAEVRIPYSALRFPEKDEQLWGIQFGRKITHLNETYVWNYVDKKVGKISQYTGLLKGIRNIDSPVRLSFYPYTSFQTNYYDTETKTNFSAGMDLKYGINDAFTLDATLVPDFGQAAFDEVELNLGPFEQTYGENRAFFTEGTELFTKGDLFYSRRVGDTPTDYEAAKTDLRKNEELIENPEKTDLLNALKISGRTEDNLGIGFFNAVTKEVHATYRDTLTNQRRERITEPLANYNILVLDQQFNQNSSISLINTNVTREGHFRDGNVTGFLFDLYNNSNSYNISGEAKMSNVNLEDRNLPGFASELSLERTKGNIRFGLSHEFANESYDINDLGVNFTNNYNNFFGRVSYQIFEPTEHFNALHINLYGNHRRRYKPDVTVGSGVGASFFAVNHERFAFGGFLEANSKHKDFFEPRKEGRFIEYNKNMSSNAWISSDYRKKFAIDARVGYMKFFNSDQDRWKLHVSPRVRLNDQFNMIYSFKYVLSSNRDSFVSLEPDDIIFGNRNMKSLENSIQANYNFNTRQAINLSFRNFWSTASYTEGEYARLNEDGSLSPVAYEYNQDDDPNVNFNIWNLDLSYHWQFAPGSEAILLYRNSIFNEDNLSELPFDKSLDNLLRQPARHNISLRVVYYIDYNNIQHLFKA